MNSLCNFEPSKSEKILTDALLEPVTLIVTLSMVLTPVIYWIMACKIIPLFHKELPPEYDEIPQQDNQLSLLVLGALDKLLRVLPAYST